MKTNDYERKDRNVDPQIFFEIKKLTLQLYDWIDHNYAPCAGLNLEYIVNKFNNKIYLTNIDEVMISNQKNILPVKLKDSFGKLNEFHPKVPFRCLSAKYRKTKVKDNSFTTSNECDYTKDKDLNHITTRLNKNEKLKNYVGVLCDKIDQSKVNLSTFTS